ncbi:DgyrCDS5430 [Dimorphilus gyrociliatus]|uniref:FK506-binding protein n=1 Tax=Dimorphilus gyrociliatus TaxID=2664684 RepID=A0A7I8VM72_9ANNE|nr:DgyrCDS5430 [Dimorphilus gyrociliatus]
MKLSDYTSTFWGVKVPAESSVSQTCQKSFQLTMACLKVTEEGGTNTQKSSLYFKQEGSDDILLCALDNSNQCQRLNLAFRAGDKIDFFADGPNEIHLSGFLIDPDNSDDDEDYDADADVNALVNNGDFGLMEDDDSDDESYAEEECMVDNAENDSDDDSDVDDSLDDEEVDVDDEIDEDDDEEVDDDDNEDDDDDDDEDEDDEEEDDDDEDGDEEEAEEEVEAPQLVQSEKKKKNGVEKTNGKDNKKRKLQDRTLEEQSPTQKKKQKTETKKVKRVLKGNIVAVDELEGKGSEAKEGKKVLLYYTGKLGSNGKEFDSCTSGKPFAFRLGSNEVIKGWEIGVKGMKVGGKRTLTIPPKMAYGGKSLPGIPSNSTLVFDLELKGVKK